MELSESSSPVETVSKVAEGGIPAQSNFQKPLAYNRHLPYCNRLQDEASELLEEIKVNLSAAVQKWELWPGTLYWTNRLSSYARIYGYQFSKADHLKLVKLMYELVTIPNLESPLVHTWAGMLGRLLQKLRLLTPDDLQLPWRPTYKLVQQVFHSKYKQLGMRIYSTAACNAVHRLVSLVRNYFPLESTQEMLDEWRPSLCPFDLAMVEAINLLSEMLPTTLPPQHHDRGFKLWFEEFLHLWLGIHATTAAEEFFVKLFVRVAKHNIGCIDWTPYLPRIFTRILRSFQLPVGSKELQTGAHKEYLDASKAAILIVSFLGGNSQAQEHLDKLMIALESYYHPSNVGKHTRKLLLFLKDLALQFIVRLKKERHSKPCWFFYVPDSAKLTESDIDAFVRCLLPAVRMAVFSKVGTLEASLTLHNLALVRPEMVLPDLLNRTYAALETLTEPHQVTATLQCVTGVSRTLLSGGGGRYVEGQTHLFSLLMLALPGIDPNDFRKTLVSGLLISALVSLVPLVDCSPAIGHFEMTEAEVELCSLTSQFEDFVLQFLDRCFALVENTGLEQTTALDRIVSAAGKGNHESIMGMGVAGCFALVENTGLEQTTALDRIVSAASRDNHESIMGMGVAGSVHSVLVQCSPKLFEVALDKLYRFATSHVFETEVAGRMCADMCAAAAKVDADSTLKRFIPHCVRAINMILEDPDQRESEHPDNDLIWNIQLLAHILHGQGEALVSSTDALIGCLKNCVHLKCKSAALHAAKALGNTLHCLTMIYPCESRSLATDFSAPPEEHLYIRDWSAAGDLNHLGLKWHVPSVEELQMTDRLMEEFLLPELNRLEAFMQGEPMDRDSLHQSLQLVWYLLLGTSAYLPMWKGEQLAEGCPSSEVKMSRDDYIFGPENAKMPAEQFSRENLAKFVHRLSGYILEKCEDDTKSMFCLVKILQLLLANFGADKFDFENKWRAYKQTKMALEDKLHGKKQHIRPMLITRIHLQHELRMLERSMSTLTSLHLTLMRDLFRMAVSTYAEVRILAQNSLAHCLDVYLYSGRNLLPDIFPLLRGDDGVSHEQFKGALHVMLLPPVMSVYLHDWPLMKKTLPMIVKADHSEKPSILNLMNRILREVLSRYDYFTLEFQVSDGSLAAAASLHSALSLEEVRQGKARTEEVNQASLSDYEGLVDCLVNLVEQEKLQWRYSQMAAQFLVILIRHDHPFPVSGVKLLVKSLNHDALAVRKLAICAMSLILLQQKRVHAKVPVDVAKEAGVEELNTSLPPGERDDNKWLLYDADHLPRTEQEWNTFTFIDKTHWGYYAWPKTLYTYAPYDQQPPLDRKPEQLSEAERVVYDAFTSPEFVDRLVSFLSLEENKGRDHYDTNRFSMFKGMFRNFGATFMPLFRPHLEKLAVDSQESNQRCASEIIAGMVSGSKLWSFQMVQEMWSYMEPLMSKVLDVITPETVEDWAAAMTDISANRDPRRLRWLLELMMVNPLHGTNGSFLDASRLYLLQSVLAQQEWRAPSLQNRMLEYLKPLLAHPFKNVRERIGSVLAQIFLHDVEVMQLKFNPRRRDFLELVSPRFPTIEQLPTVAQDKSVLQFCKTVLVWLITSYQHSEPEYFQLLAELLPLTTVEDDEEIVALMKSTCAQMSHAEVPSALLPAVLSSTKKAIETDLWKVRVAALQLLQVSVFENLFVFGPASVEITDLLLRLIGDTQMEVRELAASTVSGLVRCGYISCIDKLKTLFVKHARIKLPKKAILPNSAVSDGYRGYEGLLVVRHSGVLGLAALVEACPYSVPEWLPEVVDELALHLHDPAPIQGTVKRAMSEFRRTHYDSWNEHKQKFTDDQLAVLADLLISPSYYA